LNLGVSGFVKDYDSTEYLKHNKKIGDILNLEVVEEFCSEVP
jgi:hypothetical protein